uniref:Uncharacterized protein n=1 Tax=Ananas comosus var. bracteatus TaxID=296719 RepID=A0A6V7PNJ1_ANACO|nr:unnamed protein product [Ananas comosus var. bracteatus]
MVMISNLDREREEEEGEEQWRVDTVRDPRDQEAAGASRYRSLSVAEGSSRGGGSRRPLVAAAAGAAEWAEEEEWTPAPHGGHRRARSEFPAPAPARGSEWFPESDLRAAASRSTREKGPVRAYYARE